MSLWLWALTIICLSNAEVSNLSSKYIRIAQDNTEIMSWTNELKRQNSECKLWYYSQIPISQECKIESIACQNYTQIFIKIKLAQKSLELYKQVHQNSKKFASQGQLNVDRKVCQTLSQGYQISVDYQSDEIEGGLAKIYLNYQNKNASNNNQEIQKGLAKYFAFLLLVFSCLILIFEIVAVIRFIKRKRSPRVESNLLGKSSRIENSVS